MSKITINSLNNSVTHIASAFIGETEYCVAASSPQQAQIELKTILHKMQNVKEFSKK